MKLSEHIDLYYGGNVTKYAAMVGKNYTTVINQIAAGYCIDDTRVFKISYKLPQAAIDHVKKIRGEL